MLDGKVRLHRTWKWITVPGQTPTIGGPPPKMKCIPVDTPEYLNANGRWEPFPIVEEPKPIHPQDAQQQAQQDEFQQRSARQMSTIMGELARAAGIEPKK